MKNLLYIFLFLGNLACKPSMYYYPKITKQSLDSSTEVMNKYKLFIFEEQASKYYKLSFYQSFQKDSTEDFNYRYLNTYTGSDRNLNKVINGQSDKIVQEVFIRFNPDGSVYYIAPYKYKPLDSSIINLPKPGKWKLNGFLIQPEYESGADSSEKKFQMILFKPLKCKEVKRTGIKIDSVTFGDNGIKLIPSIDDSTKIKFNSTDTTRDDTLKTVERLLKKRVNKFSSEIIVLEFLKEGDGAISISKAYVEKDIQSQGLSHIWIDANKVFNYGTLSKYDQREARLFFKPKSYNASDTTQNKKNVDDKNHVIEAFTIKQSN